MSLTQAVRVWTRSATGEDAVGDPTYAWSYVDVDGVLVRTGAGGNIGERTDGRTGGGDLRPDGVRVEYTLAFPKGYDGPRLRHARITLLHPSYGMDADTVSGWRTALVVSGDPAPQVPCPTSWDTIVEVGRTDG